MSSVASSSNASSSGSAGSRPDVDPVLRNALRYTVSAKEYKLLHQYLISRAPPAARKRVPQPRKYEAIVKSTDDYNASAIRASLRLGVSAYTALKLWDVVTTRLMGRGKAGKPQPRSALWKSPNIRLSVSLSLILFFHRILHRFFIRLRETLLTDSAKPFRRRNPRVTKTLTSRLAPAIGASLSGFALGLCPADQLRITIAIYVLTRSLEFTYNGLEERGWFKNRPWWFGSWLLFPATCGQLLHAFVFDRDCFPESYGKFILKNSPEYIHERPAEYPSHLQWPSTFQVVDSLADMAKLRWPPFISPIIFPAARTLPRSLTAIAPITSPAHPSIRSLSCALLHPHDPSCARVYLSYYLRAFPPVARFFTLVFAVLSLPRYKAFVSGPFTALNKLAQSILRMSLFVVGAIGTSWSSICLFQHYLPRSFLPTQRFFLGGMLGGLFAFVERKHGRSTFLYSVRLSIDSLWKVGKKRGWWKGIRNGDVALFVVCLALINAVYELEPRAVQGGVVRKGLGMLRGEGWVDRAVGVKGKEMVEGEGEEEEE